MKKWYVMLIALIMCSICACSRQEKNADKQIDDNTEYTNNVENTTTTEQDTEVNSLKSSGIYGYDENDLIMYCQEVGFLNKEGRIFRIGENQSCDFKFNVSSVWNTYDSYDKTGLFGQYAIVSVFDYMDYKTRLYYLDSEISPILLSTQDNINSYYEMLKSDISADGKWVLYLENPKSKGDMGRMDDFDLRLYNAKDNSNVIIATNVQGATFTLDGEHLVYYEMSPEYVENGNTDNKRFTVVNLKTLDERKVYAENDYGDNIYFTGLWEIKANGDILIFNSIGGSESYYVDGVSLIRNNELYTLFASGQYNIIANRDMSEMFVIKDDRIFYYDIEELKSVDLGENYRISIPILSRRKSFIYSIDSFDNTVFVSEDGVYLWDRSTLNLEKILSMEWYQTEVSIINYFESDTVIVKDYNKLCRIDNISQTPEITTIFTTADGNISDTMYDISPYQSLDANLWFIVDEDIDYVLYGLDKYGRVLHKISGELIDSSNFSDIGYLPYTNQYILTAYDYNDNEHIYTIDANVEQVKLIEDRNVEDVYTLTSVWMVYSLEDGMLCMYNGEKVIDIGLPAAD